MSTSKKKTESKPTTEEIQVKSTQKHLIVTEIHIHFFPLDIPLPFSGKDKLAQSAQDRLI